MKKRARNDMVKQKGFANRAQMRYLLHRAKTHPEQYNWVLDVLRDHGVPSEENASNDYWEAPYNVSPDTPSYVYTGGKTSMNLEQFIKMAKQKLAESVVDSEQAKKVASMFWSIHKNEFTPDLSQEQLAQKLYSLEQFKPYQQLNANDQAEAIRFLGDYVLGRQVTAMKKIASYTDKLIRMFEGKDKFSSVEEALSNFSERLGLDDPEIKILRKQAMVRIAQLKSLQDEGITDPKAIEYMSKAKGKHTSDSGSPFVLDPNTGKKVKKKLEQRKQDLTPEEKTLDDQSNEFGDNATSEGNAFAAQVERLQRYAQELGKVLPFGSPSSESIEDLKSELGVQDVDTPFKTARYGFNFTDFDGKFPQQGQPIKVTAYQYSFLKDELIKLINNELRQKLAEELDFDQWVQYLESQVKEQRIPSQEGWELIDKLEKMKRQLYGDENTKPFFIDESGKRLTQQIKKMMGWFPGSYQKLILEMLAKGKYRHILSEASGKPHSGIFPTSYRKASFILMDSFAPYQALTFKPEKEKLMQLLKQVVQQKKQTYSFEEFQALLNSLDIQSEAAPSSQEFQVVPLHPKVKIRIDNIANDQYKPTTYSEQVTSTEGKEQLLQKFHDSLTSAINQDLPLAYQTEQDGSIKEMKISDIAQSKSDFTSSKVEDRENPNAGLHPSYQGEKVQTRAPSSKRDLPVGRKKAPSSESSETSQDMSGLLERLKKMRSSSVDKIIQKYAQATGLWVDDQGRSYNSEQEMTEVLQKEMLEQSLDSIANQVTSTLMQEIEQPQQTQQPQKIDQEELEHEPLAANLKVRKILAQLKLYRR